MDNLKEQLAREIAEIRKSGHMNMYYRKMVLEEISKDCSEEMKEFIKAHEKDYLELLKLSGKY